jgi:HSP20 family protein
MVPKKEDEDEEPRPSRRGPPKSPFDEFFRGFGIEPDEFDRMFEQMNRALQEAMRNLGGFEPGKPYVHGFSFKIGPDGKPIVSEFGNRPQKPASGSKPVISPEREPLTDLIEERNQIAATLEIPGVDKKDIDIRVTETEIEINVDNEKRKYHKLIRLPSRVKPTTTKATYKNGVLDVTVQKEAPSEAKKGHRVNVD